ncbi:hypothetical protein ACIQRW_34140 [Streptomyces sp. NPDC091287]|uniref:hypothetical protein n=1 Tax=Streptomyces sp. NPDC091287 TaxID=3365988 RepID=UPI003817FD23
MESPLLSAAAHLYLLAGLRRDEALRLTVADYTPGPAPTVRVAPVRTQERRIRIALTAAAAVDAYLATEAETSADEPLLLGLRSDQVRAGIQRAARHASLAAGVHDLRRASMAVVIGEGHPGREIEAYFGLSRVSGRRDLTVLTGDWDAPIAGALERAFTE